MESSGNTAEEEAATGEMDLTSTDLEISHDGSTQQIVGIVFPSIGLDASSTIAGTRLVFDVDEVNSESAEAVTVRIYGELSLSAAQPSSTAGDLSSRSKTAAYVDWSPEASTATHVLLYTPDLATIVSEIVGQSGWVSGSPMAFLLEHVSGSGTRWVEAYYSNSGSGAVSSYAELTGGSGVTPALEVTGQAAPPTRPPSPPTPPTVPPSDTQWSPLSQPGCDAACGTVGTRALDYACTSLAGGVRAEADCPFDRPQQTEACYSRCFHISPGGSDEAAGTLAAPLRTADACLQRWSSEAVAGCGAGSCAMVHRCVLHAGVYTEATNSTQRSEVTLEAAEGEDVLFDATDAVEDVGWAAAANASDLWVASFSAAVPRLAALLVDGEGAQCEVVDGCTPSVEEPDACDGFVPPESRCFAFSPEVSWARRFERSQAARCFDLATSEPEGQRCAGVLPDAIGGATGAWWWWDAAGGLRVHRASFTQLTGRAWPPTLRLKAASRALAADFGAGSSGVLIKGLRFRAAAVSVKAAGLSALRVSHCRFLYAPTTAATLYTYNGNGRGGGSRVWLTSNVFEFAEGAVNGAAYVKGKQAVVEDNYFAFNDYSYRGRYTVGSWSQGERLEHNTVLYNGDWGVYKPASGYSTLSHNLVVATNYLGVWHDTAVFHVMCAPRASAPALGEGGGGGGSILPHSFVPASPVHSCLPLPCHCAGPAPKPAPRLLATGCSAPRRSRR